MMSHSNHSSCHTYYFSVKAKDPGPFLMGSSNTHRLGPQSKVYCRRKRHFRTVRDTGSKAVTASRLFRLRCNTIQGSDKLLKTETDFDRQ